MSPESVCVSVIRGRMRIIARMRSIGFKLTIGLTVMKFGQSMHVDDPKGQGHRSKVKVTMAQNVISCLT